MSDKLKVVAAESQRVQAEYLRRSKVITHDLYAPWRPETALMTTGARRIAAQVLHRLDVFPHAGDKCLEIGFGALGWLGELINWGLREEDLHGIELNPVRVKRAKEVLPIADLRVGDATKLPWGDDTFRLVIASTVFTSILDSDIRHLIAEEIVRVLIPGGALLWYDFAFNNPRNPNVRKVTRKELTQLFPQLEGQIKSVTLAPPLARFTASKSWILATFLEAIPWFRTHLLAVLVKRS